MKEVMKCVSHQQASQLLHNKFVVVLGDSIQRSVYKDLVLLLQKEKYLTSKQLKSKGEMSFEQDLLVEGGCLGTLHNGTEYQEVRQFQSAHHLVRFYFVTRIYSQYMRSILQDFRQGLKPDVVIVNSCVWDISRYLCNWTDNYKDNLHKFFLELSEILPEETLVIWNLTMPLGEKIKGGFLVPEIEHKAPQLRQDVIEANFYSGTLADSYGMDVLDLHFQFRFSLHHRTSDGVHWNALAHRRITSLLLQHSARAWGVIMPCPLTAVDHTEVIDAQPSFKTTTKPTGVGRVASAIKYHHTPPFDYFSNMEHRPSRGHDYDYRGEPCLPFGVHNSPQPYHHMAYRPALSPPLHLPAYRCQDRPVRNGFDDRPPYHFQPYHEHHHSYVMRSRHTRHHYAPYTHDRPHHGHY